MINSSPLEKIKIKQKKKGGRREKDI